MLYRLAYSPVLGRHFLNWVSLRLNDSSLCQVNIKIAKTPLQVSLGKLCRRLIFRIKLLSITRGVETSVQVAHTVVVPTLLKDMLAVYRSELELFLFILLWSFCPFLPQRQQRSLPLPSPSPSHSLYIYFLSHYFFIHYKSF